MEPWKGSYGVRSALGLRIVMVCVCFCCGPPQERVMPGGRRARAQGAGARRPRPKACQAKSAGPLSRRRRWTALGSPTGPPGLAAPWFLQPRSPGLPEDWPSRRCRPPARRFSVAGPGSPPRSLTWCSGMLARLQVGGRKGEGLRGRGRGGQQAGWAGPPPRRLLKPEGTQGESLTDRHLALLPPPRGAAPRKPAPLRHSHYALPPIWPPGCELGGEREMQAGCSGVVEGDIG